MSANLHRVGKQADWEMVEPDSRNGWQRIASITRGLITPANAVSLYGAKKVKEGLDDIKQGNILAGSLTVGIGRLADIADGTVADLTGTKSPVGEAVDATLDKLTVAAAIPILVQSEVISKEFATFTVAQNLANTALTGVAKAKGNEIHSTWAGKRSVGFLWGAIGLKGLAKAVREGEHHKVANVLEEYSLRGTAEKIHNIDGDKLAHKLDVAGRVVSSAYIALGAAATSQYARAAMKKKKK